MGGPGGKESEVQRVHPGELLQEEEVSAVRALGRLNDLAVFVCLTLCKISRDGNNEINPLSLEQSENYMKTELT